MILIKVTSKRVRYLLVDSSNNFIGLDHLFSEYRSKNHSSMKVLYSRMTDRNKARNVTLSKLRGTDGGVKSKATTCRLSDSYRSSVTDSQREGSRRPRSATRTSPLMNNDHGWSPDDSLVGSITTIQQTSI